MTQRLSAEDWADAALDALGRGGLPAIAVEPIAARLGTTKGSFYWHFRNRDALIEAALHRWEERGTSQVIEALKAEEGPEAKLRKLFTTVIAFGLSHRIELSLLGSRDHPAVGPVLQRVAERRVTYVRELFEEVGFTPEEAHHRATLGVSIYLGHTQLAHTARAALPENVDALITSAIDALLTAPTPAPPTPPTSPT
ncbi:TetR/AcrR family transcriptional regulator [Actinorhabdospora filicis]|nr:TetR/AcrR family transcriptional regulator [Actinorhabdospora filicis]